MSENQPVEAVEAITPEEPVFVKQNLAARRINVSLRQLRRWIIDGRLSVYRPSRNIALVEWKEVEEMVRKSRQETAAK